MTVSSNISKAVHITNGAVRDYAFNIDYMDGTTEEYELRDLFFRRQKSRR